MSRCRGFQISGERCRLRYWLNIDGYCTHHDPNPCCSEFRVNFETLPRGIKNTILREEINTKLRAILPKIVKPGYNRRKTIMLSMVETIELESRIRFSVDTIREN